jgi:hypothetical protein
MDNYIFITAEGDPFSIADRLQDEGKNVVVGLIEDPPQEETPESDKKRHELYEGILDVKPAESVLEMMKKIPNKDDWFVMFDYGNLWPWSERALEMGFRKGIFPTEEGYSLEEDRKKAKDFVKQHYPRLKLSEAGEFSSAEDGIAFLEENPDKVFVLKSEGSNAETVVPETPDPELARLQLIGALRSEKSGYEAGGFTLEEKIPNPLEISPVMVFWDGKPLFSLVELENKGFGAGNVGRLTGGCQNLTIHTKLDCHLNTIAFPDVIYDLAAKQSGIAIYDAGMLSDGKDFYFTEFCAQRWGWDGIFSELAMCYSPSTHFDLISEGVSPIVFKYGVAVRMFQTQPHSDHGGLFKDGYSMDWMREASDHLFFYSMKKEMVEDTPQFLSVGYRKDVGVAVAGSDYMEAAVSRAYAAIKAFAMTGIYYRPQFDFLSESYSSSIKNRYKWLVKSGLI